MLLYYIEKGAKVDMPPDQVSKLYTDGTRTHEYRKSPFIIQAACAGSMDCFNTVLKNGGKITEQGYILLSRKKKNQVVSNAIGAAASHASIDILKNLMSRSSGVLNINHLASEK